MKINRIILVLLLSGICSAASAYRWDPSVYEVGKRYAGFIIKLDGDTLYGFIEAKQRCAWGGLGNSNQNKCEFYQNENDKKPYEKYGPEDISGYKIADKFYKSIPHSGGLIKKKNFCIQVIAGHLATYEWYSTQENFSSFEQNAGESLEDFDKRRYNIQTVLKSVNGKNAYDWGSLILGFAKKMSELTQDYPELSEKVKNKEKGYGAFKVYEIIDEYNKYWKDMEGDVPVEIKGNGKKEEGE